MDSIKTYMSDDHERCDTFFNDAELAAAKGDWDAAARQWTAFGVALERHLHAEEGVLFPAFEAATGSTAGPTAVMRSEHQQLRALLLDAEQALVKRDQENWAGLADTFTILIQQHNLKEESVLYPMMDRMLPTIRAELLATIEAMPTPAPNPLGSPNGSHA